VLDGFAFRVAVLPLRAWAQNIHSMMKPAASVSATTPNATAEMAEQTAAVLGA
jgi:hypothetical protein